MDYNITFPEQSINLANAGGLVMISVVIIIGFILLMRYSPKIMPGFLGLLVYLLVVVAGTELVTYVITMIPGVNALFLATSMSFCIGRAVVMALLTHLTRWIVIKFTDRNQNIALGDALMGGFGIAIAQALISGWDLMYISTLGTTINTYGMEYMLTDMPADEIASAMESVMQAVEMPSMFYLCKGINGAIDIVFQTAVCLLMYAMVKKGLPAFWHGIIIALNVVLQGASYFADYLVVGNYMALTMTKIAVIVAVVIMVLKVDTMYLGGELKSFDKLRTGRMPKVSGNLKNKTKVK